MQSLVAIGALFGCIIAGLAVDLLGRKVAIIVGAIPLELGWLLLFFAENRLMLYCGRVITGVGCGIETLAVAVSIVLKSQLQLESEMLNTSPSKNRSPNI